MSRRRAILVTIATTGLQMPIMDFYMPNDCPQWFESAWLVAGIAAFFFLLTVISGTQLKNQPK